MKLQGKRALITGGAKRVGRMIAKTLAERGVNLILHYNTSRTEVLAAQKELSTAFGVSVSIFQADLKNVRTLEQKTKKLVRDSGPIHILVNNASSFYSTPFGTITETDWDSLMNSNLKGPFFLTQIVGQSMAKSGGGKIVNIGDWSALRPYKDYLPYSIAKAGVIALTQILAKTLAPKVTVNCVSPGAVLLPENFSSKIKREIIKKTPLGRMGTPEDIARGVLFFLEGTDFATGSNLIVDGGQLIR
ncbi:MAG: SDR family oxidoreductase [Candidatus Omnitrophica bacterium]|nr:SDR family oxidoreductase [Candidatus Omnitrophota bacterium]